MAGKKRGLGKGLDVLFGDEMVAPGEGAERYTSATDKRASASGEVLVKVSSVIPDANQPRKNFDQEALDELTESIKEHGVLTPLIVRKKGENYEIIAGERRWRAAQAAGLREVPVVIREYTNEQAAEIAIIENLQREDLNPIEEAQAYAQLIEDYGLSQEEVAKKVSKNRTTITNALRLLKLVPQVRSMVIEGSISAGHARALLALEDTEKQEEVAREIILRKLSVRETEKKVRSLSRKKPEKKKPEEPERDLSVFYREYENKLKEALGTKVHINRKDKNKGRIEIEYYSQAELERIMELLER